MRGRKPGIRDAVDGQVRDGDAQGLAVGSFRLPVVDEIAVAAAEEELTAVAEGRIRGEQDLSQAVLPGEPADLGFVRLRGWAEADQGGVGGQPEIVVGVLVDGEDTRIRDTVQSADRLEAVPDAVQPRQAATVGDGPERAVRAFQTGGRLVLDEPAVRPVVLEELEVPRVLGPPVDPQDALALRADPIGAPPVLCDAVDLAAGQVAAVHPDGEQLPAPVGGHQAEPCALPDPGVAVTVREEGGDVVLRQEIYAVQRQPGGGSPRRRDDEQAVPLGADPEFPAVAAGDGGHARAEDLLRDAREAGDAAIVPGASALAVLQGEAVGEQAQPELPPVRGEQG